MFNGFNGPDDWQLLELFWRLESTFAVEGAKTLEAPDLGPRTRALENNRKHIARQ